MQPHELLTTQITMLNRVLGKNAQSVAPGQETPGDIEQDCAPPINPLHLKPGECLCHTRIRSATDIESKVILTWGQYSLMAGYGPTHNQRLVYEILKEVRNGREEYYAAPVGRIPNRRLFYNGAKLVPTYENRDRWPFGSAAMPVMLHEDEPEWFNIDEPTSEEINEIVDVGTARGLSVKYEPARYCWIVRDGGTGRSVVVDNTKKVRAFLHQNGVIDARSK